jgi:hypothetical protein
MSPIFKDILGKMHEFGVKHHGKTPNWIYISHDQYYEIMASNECRDFCTFNDHGLSLICRMQFVIKEDILEIEVQ